MVQVTTLLTRAGYVETIQSLVGQQNLRLGKYNNGGMTVISV